MRNIFKEKSIVVLNIKYGVKKQSVKKIFERFGEIKVIKTSEAKNGTIKAFIRYENEKSVTEAMNYSPIVCCGIPLTIRQAFMDKHQERKCNCLICDKELISEYRKVQNNLFEATSSFHNATNGTSNREAMRKVQKELKATNKRLYKRIKKAIGP